MYNKVLEIVINICQVDIIRKDPNIDLLENDCIDSMDFIELIAALEEEFDIELQPTQIPNEVWKNVENLSKFIENKVKEKNNG